MTASLPGTFRVDAEELGSLSGRLDSCTSHMRSAGYRMEQASVDGLGHAGLESACSGFRDSWEYGIDQLAKLTDAIRGGLDQTAKNYSATDAAIERMFTPASTSTGGTSHSAYSVADDFG